ncbi:MAG: 23S rRNA (guanosine(2251)-2'-O)-methyltransferase RlmB [Clostridia bacterium]|nr:23S rRNA (guanosine(2251)-2'-O)-methyltransferase RlmB [Clostridia bacterium]
MFIEGKNAIRQALEGGSTINKVMVDKNYQSRKDEIIALAAKNKVKVEFLPKIALDKHSKTGHHQGYIAETVEFEYCTIEDILNVSKDKGTNPFIVLLDGIEDPHNFGAIIRSCECAGVDGIIIAKNRACQVNETVIRTSTGAITNVKIAKVTNLKDAISMLKENDVWVFAAEAGGEQIYNRNLSIPVALVIGSEGFGVKKTVIASCDGVVSLPLMGKVNSLNASVACGICVFEVVRQRATK